MKVFLALQSAMRDRPSSLSMFKPELDTSLENAATTWLSAKRGKPQWSGPPTLARLATKILPQNERTGGVGISQLQARWVEIVGDKIASITQPDLIKGETLVVKVAAAAAPFIMMRSEEIVGLIRLSGGTKIKRLTLIRAPLSKPSSQTQTKQGRPLNAQESRLLDQKLQAVIEPDLKAALRRLADATSDID
jgi:hypothetical protein